MRKAFDNLIKKLRPQLIPLVESYNLPDFVLTSSIGNSFGDIYEKQLELAMNSPMNRTKDAIPSYFEDYIKPFLHEEPKYTNPIVGKL